MKMKRLFFVVTVFSLILTALPALAEGGGEAYDALLEEYAYGNTDEAHEAYDALLEEYVITKFENLDTSEAIRQYDELALKVVAETEKAVNVPPPFASAQGYVMFPYGAVVPRIICRPFRVSDIALEPGEEILGIHAGDTVRWLLLRQCQCRGILRFHMW